MTGSEVVRPGWKAIAERYLECSAACRAHGGATHLHRIPAARR